MMALSGDAEDGWIGVGDDTMAEEEEAAEEEEEAAEEVGELERMALSDC